MAARYVKGQKVIIEPMKNQHLSPRDSALELYAGKSGIIIDFFWINVSRGTRDFYIYTVRIETGHKEIVVHEDELRAYTE